MLQFTNVNFNLLMVNLDIDSRATRGIDNGGFQTLPVIQATLYVKLEY